MKPVMGKIVATLAAGALTAAGYYGWSTGAREDPPAQFASGYGRIETCDIGVATAVSGRVDEVFVHEGQFVRAGQVLARMQDDSLLAERDEADALHTQALGDMTAAEAKIRLRETETRAAEAAVRQYEGEFEAVMRQVEGASSEDEIEDFRAIARRVAAAASAAESRLAASRVAIAVARVEATSAQQKVAATESTIRRVATQLAERELKASSDGIVEGRVADAGEVLTVGGRVVNLVDLDGVSMTFLLPAAAASNVAVGSEARIVLDAEPQVVMLATISRVARAAPLASSLRTGTEPQNGTYRIDARIDREFARQHFEHLLNGAAGVAWVRLNPLVPWPPALALTDHDPSRPLTENTRTSGG